MRTVASTRFALIGLSLMACTGSEPRDGEWAFSNVTVEENGCNLDEGDLVPVGLINLRVDDVDAFIVGLQDGSPPIACVLDGDDFGCAPDVTMLPLGDASLDLTTTLEGTFASSTSADVTQSLVGECEGDECGVAAALLGLAFPCTVQVGYTIDWMSDDLGVLEE